MKTVKLISILDLEMSVLIKLLKKNLKMKTQFSTESTDSLIGYRWLLTFKIESYAFMEVLAPHYKHWLTFKTSKDLCKSCMKFKTKNLKLFSIYCGQIQLNQIANWVLFRII